MTLRVGTDAQELLKGSSADVFAFAGFMSPGST
jgi:hypothetical protein